MNQSLCSIWTKSILFLFLKWTSREIVRVNDDRQADSSGRCRSNSTHFSMRMSLSFNSKGYLHLDMLVVNKKA